MREVLSIGILDETTVFAQTVIFLTIWIIALTAIILTSWKRRDTNSGLVLIYAISLALIHFVASLVYFFNPRQLVDEKWMFYGFKEATFGIVAFAIGSLILTPFILNLINFRPAIQDSKDIVIPEYQKLFAKKYFNIGAIAFFILPIFLFDIPTARALVGAAQQLLSVGICIICWIAWKENNKAKLRRWLIVAFCFPFITVIFHGYLGVGTNITMVIIFFIARFFKLKLRILLIGVILAYLGLSVYLSYMRDRGPIRDAVWSERSFVERIDAAKNVILKPEWFNPFSLRHLEIIDSRLNQNVLVGAAVDNLESGKVDFAYGESITNTIYALIPRVFWKEKFLITGASGLVIKYTGIQFGSGTSVGLGQVMEFYINFGRLGIVFGFLILGVFISIIDQKAGYYLSQGEIYKFVLWFLPGLAFICGGGSLTEITASAGANIVVARLVTSRYSNLLYLFLITAVIFGLINRMIGGG